MASSATISVIIPVKNEEAGIGTLLEFLMNALPYDKEVILMDGRSTDRTREIIAEFTARNPKIRMIDNPHGFVPFALNAAIQSSIADYIIRLDAHTEYAPDYFLKVLETFEKSGAEIVGGPMRAIGKTDLQKSIAYCTSTPFGVGDSSFHDENAEGFVDSVYLGAWRKSIFPIVGLFDEEMLRNQDDEFHYRANSKGMKIYLNPEIRSLYYPRSTYSSLFKQYFQYGLFKPLVLKKVKSGIRIRHLVPACFFLYCLALPFAYYLLNWLVLIPLFLYLLLDLKFASNAPGNLKVKLHSLLVYPTLHFSYGYGFIAGLFGLQSRFLKK